MSVVFVDTSALYAVFVPSDGKHGEATRIFRELGRERASLVATDLVLIESYILVHARTGRTGLLRFHAAVGKSAWLQRIIVTHEHQLEAWRLIEQRQDKEYSFIDATSFVMMRALGVERVFTFDDHFAQEGFDAIGA